MKIISKKISFITTVYNEEESIQQFLYSLFSQTKLPDEIIIVDGMSTDQTVDRIKNQESRIKNKKILFKLIIKKGNRSVGRNTAIKKATGDIIVCSDAGNILDKNWLKNIIEPFKDTTVDVVAGYYRARAKNVFQKCVVPYALVMEDKINAHTFLPATRSIAFKKSIWKKVGGFDKKLSHNEDYVFARKMKKSGAKIVFKKNAVVYWLPRKNYIEAFIMMFRFAIGDAEAGIYRPKVILLFLRYILLAGFIYKLILSQSTFLFLWILFLILAYLSWSVYKNYRYVKRSQAFYILPLLQLTADAAVGIGTMWGVFHKKT